MTKRTANLSALLLISLSIHGTDYLVNSLNAISPISDDPYRIIAYLWIIISGGWAVYLLRTMKNRDYWQFHFKWSNLAYVIVSFILFILIVFLSNRFFPRTANAQQLATVNASLSGMEKLLIFPSFSMIIGPIREELIHRGVVWTLADNFSKEKLGWLLSSATFSLMHLPYFNMRLTDFMTFFAIGLVLGWVYKKSHSIYWVIIAHMAWNIFGFIIRHV